MLNLPQRENFFPRTGVLLGSTDLRGSPNLDKFPWSGDLVKSTTKVQFPFWVSLQQPVKFQEFNVGQLSTNISKSRPTSNALNWRISEWAREKVALTATAAERRSYQLLEHIPHAFSLSESATSQQNRRRRRRMRLKRTGARANQIKWNINDREWIKWYTKILLQIILFSSFHGSVQFNHQHSTGRGPRTKVTTGTIYFETQLRPGLVTMN